VNRRSALLFAGVAGVGAAVGAGAFVWRQRQGASSGSSDTLWSQRFERPEGGELAMSAFRGRPLVLNFWATWCPPCVSELPLLDRSHRTQPAGGWQVVGLAVDKLGPVREFLQKHPVEFPVGLVGIDGIELARQLGNQGSALPFTVVFGRRGRIVRRKLGAIQPADLIDWEAEVR
jgi:thiol-disulfide isomerase/thioredoxin